MQRLLTAPGRGPPFQRSAPPQCRKRQSRRQPSAARYHTFCMFRPRGFSPPRRFAPCDGFGCVATQASRDSLRCWPFLLAKEAGRANPSRWSTLTGARSDPEGTRTLPFPQRGHPTKNLRRRQPTPPLGGARCPPAVAAHTVPTRRSYRCAWPTPGRLSVDAYEPCRSLLPARCRVRVLPWVSVPAALVVRANPLNVGPRPRRGRSPDNLQM